MRITNLLATLTLTAGLGLAASSCIIVTGNRETADLCGDCGAVYGSDECCDPEAERCGCGMIKGSLGCCE